VWNDEPYDSKSDVWSLGCVLYEFINLKPPFRARDMEGLYKKVTRGYFSRINKNYSDDLMALLKKLIKVNPKERLHARNFCISI
jgi:NIMA (never in mitosis gene a)-related kinase